MIKEPDDNLLRDLKNRIACELHTLDFTQFELDKIDARLNIYINNCVENTDDHNLYELLAIKRFYKLLCKYIFKSKEVKKFIVFYESLRFSGTSGRCRYKLTPIQIFQFANMLGFYIDDKKRLIREALLFVPRKYSKTTSVASLAVYDLLFGDANAQCYVAANSYKQAKICFDEIRNILKCLDKRLRHFKINREIVYNKMKGKTSKVECLAANPDKLDGLNASVNILDEYAQSDSAALKNVLTSSMGARLNPFTIVITTASDKRETPFVEMLSNYKAILREEVENDKIFAHIFQPDVDDEEHDAHTWRKVQPHMGVTVYEDFYKDEYDKAIMSADDLLEFRTKMLNIFATNTATSWIDGKMIKDHFKKVEIENITNYPITAVGVDLSVKDDFSTVTYNIYNKEDTSFHSYTDYYFPEGQLKTHSNGEMYRKWAKDGYLKLCKGKIIDYQQISNDIIYKAQRLNILAIGYDPYKSKEFINTLSAAIRNPSEVILPIKQTYGSFTSCIESFELALYRDKLTFDPNPITPYCFDNAVLDEDKLCNKKPIKRTHNLKIDATITNLETFYVYNNLEI